MTQSRLVGGRYELGELIGYGGMAEVHRGRDSRLGRDVAIKVLRSDLARDPSFLNRFRREAQSAAGLNHPSIVAVYDTGQDTLPDGTAQPYIVMEFVEGRTLRDIIKTEGRLPARRAMEIAADVAGALDFSHKNGLIHRDVKPANVMITESGAVKVMDFGIARAVADNGATVTQTANVIGTAQYLSPGAGARRNRRRTLGRLLARLPALRTRHRSATVPGRFAGRRRLSARARERDGADDARAGSAAGARLDHHEGAREEPAQPLPERRRDAHRPATRAREPAGHRGSGDDRRRAHAVHRAHAATARRDAAASRPATARAGGRAPHGPHLGRDHRRAAARHRHRRRPVPQARRGQRATADPEDRGAVRHRRAGRRRGREVQDRQARARPEHPDR